MVGVRQWERAVGDGGGDDDGGDGLAVEQEAVEDVLELFDGGCVDLDEEAVFAGDAVALADLGQGSGEFGELGQLSGGGPDAGAKAVTGSPRAAGSMSRR